MMDIQFGKIWRECLVADPAYLQLLDAAGSCVAKFCSFFVERGGVKLKCTSLKIAVFHVPPFLFFWDILLKNNTETSDSNKLQGETLDFIFPPTTSHE